MYEYIRSYNIRTMPAFLLALILLNYNCEVQAANQSNNACHDISDYPSISFNKNCYRDPDVDSGTPELILRHNYTLENYTAITSDGYILTLFRLPARNDDNRKHKQPIFIQHGVTTDSAIWVDIGKRSLADRGYDVWLGNQRRMKYSRNFTGESEEANDLWNYNLDDLATYDLKASLVKVVNITKKSVIYIGHSRGTTIMFMHASENRDVGKLVKAFIALSPVVYFDDSTRIRIVLQMAPIVVERVKLLGMPAILYPAEEVHKTFVRICTYLPWICRKFIDASFGKTGQFLPDDLLKFYNKIFGTMSFYEYLQYSQIYKSGKFQKYDYGASENLNKYGQKEPPLYDLKKIEIPVYIYYGKSDIFSSSTTIAKLYQELGSEEKIVKSVPIGNYGKEYDFNHIDFLFSANITKFFYGELFEVLDKIH